MERHDRCTELRTARARRLASAANLLLLTTVLAAGALCCSPAKPIAEGAYATAIVGEWQGTVGDTRETIVFQPDGGFTAQLRERGFISNTLSQGVTGAIRGRWAIQGKVVTLTITSADDARAASSATPCTIVAMSQDELSLRSEGGDPSMFVRVESL